jgi:UDP-N-acetyl-D-mannosaminuronic acid dehydrogenase
MAAGTRGRASICVVGLGKVGYPTADYISKQGFRVCGYDIKPIKASFPTTTVWNTIPKGTSIYVITVSTGFKRRKPDLTSLYKVCEEISKRNPKALICMESTVLVGTCRKLAEKFDLHNFVHVPHRYWKGDPENHGVKQLRVFGALNHPSMTKGLDFYKSLQIPLHPVPMIEIAEMSKLAENAYLFVQIAFVEGLKMTCKDLGLDFDKTRDACNTKWNIRLLEAREGISGECIPKDTRYLLGQTHNDALLEGAIRIDAKYKKRMRSGQEKIMTDVLPMQ